jgi:transcriptional regulator with XRE-family HTH domain
MGITKTRVRPVSPLETARRALGLTQAEVAKRAGISPQYVGLMEGGLRPSARLRGAIGAVVQRRPEELWPS